jgi:hypothetical protein
MAMGVAHTAVERIAWPFIEAKDDPKKLDRVKAQTRRDWRRELIKNQDGELAPFSAFAQALKMVESECGEESSAKVVLQSLIEELNPKGRPGRPKGWVGKLNDHRAANAAMHDMNPKKQMIALHAVMVDVLAVLIEEG